MSAIYLDHGAVDAPQTESIRLVASAWGWQDTPPAVKTLAVKALDTQQRSRDPRRSVELTEHERALVHGFAVYNDLGLLNAHPAMSIADVVHWCDTHDAVLMLIPEITPVVVFASLPALLQFKGEGRGERKTNPLWQALGETDEVKLALAPRDAIAARLNDARNDAAIEAEEAANVWWADDLAIKQTDEGRELSRLFDHALALDATDIAIEPSRDGTFSVRLRRFGSLMSPTSIRDRWTYELGERSVRMLMQRSGANPKGGVQRLPSDGQLTYSSSAGEAFLRLSFIPQNLLGETRNLQSVAIRLFDRKVVSPRLADLRLSEDTVESLKDAVRRKEGLILVVGPTGSGKSSTIAAAIGEHIDMWGLSAKRMSIEDPVERFIAGITQYNIPPAALVEGDEQGGFAVMLRSVLRHDPDLIWIGEVRDTESAEIAVSAAVTGHLVLTTLHANGAIAGWDLLAQKVKASSRHQLVDALSAVTSQRLLEELCPHCRVARKPSADDAKQFSTYTSFKGHTTAIPNVLYAKNLQGCVHCSGTGAVGQMPIDEILVFDRAVKTAAHSLLAGEESARGLIASALKRSMQSTALALLQAGRVALDSVMV